MSDKYADSGNSPSQSKKTIIEPTESSPPTSENTFLETDKTNVNLPNSLPQSFRQQSTLIENDDQDIWEEQQSASQNQPYVSPLPQETFAESNYSESQNSPQPRRFATPQKTIVEDNDSPATSHNQPSISSLPQETFVESNYSESQNSPQPRRFATPQKTIVEDNDSPSTSHNQAFVSSSQESIYHSPNTHLPATPKREFTRPNRKKFNAPFMGITCGKNNRYQVIKLLQQGGMGQVYIALTQTPDNYYKLVAIKFLKKEFLLADNRAEIEHRFNREICLLMSLNHPNIVKIIDEGFYQLEEDNQVHSIPFYVMEYLKGQSLTEYLEIRGKLTIQEAIPLMLQIATGLTKAHQSSIIHRDLKPDNIFLIPTNNNRYVIKILDFGIAKNLDSISAVRLTNVADYFASPYYISPEHINGIRALGTWSDIYTLGLIFYEMLSGNKPFDHDEKILQTRGWPGVHHSKTPNQLINQPGCESIPVTLNNIIMKCLSKEPSKRFINAQELLNALSSFSAEMSSPQKTTAQNYQVKSSNSNTTPRVAKNTYKNTSMSQQLLLITFGLILGVAIGVLIGIFVNSIVGNSSEQSTNFPENNYKQLV